MSTRESHGAPRVGIHWRENRTAFGFVGRFSALAVIFYALALWPWFDRAIFANYLAGNAAVSGVVLCAFGHAPSVSGTVVRFNGQTVHIRRGCDALEPTALLAAAMLAFPATWRWRWRGLIMGGLFLAILNVARIVTLCLAKVHWPTNFDRLHLEIWPVAFILATLAYWLSWAGGSLARKGGIVEAATT